MVLVFQAGQEEEQAEDGDQGDDFLEDNQLEDDLADGEEVDFELEFVQDAQHRVRDLVEGAVVRNGRKHVAVEEHNVAITNLIYL